MEIPSLNSQDVITFMTKASTELNTTFPHPSTILSLGSTLPHLIPKMNALTLSGVKRAMSGFPAPAPSPSPSTKTSSSGGDDEYFIAIDSNLKPAILLRVLSRTSVPFHSVTSKFVFEEGHPEMSIEKWRDWHQKFWERDLDHDGTPFGNGVGKMVLNLIFEVVYPPPPRLNSTLMRDNEPVRAFLELIERCSEGVRVTLDQVKGVFDLGNGRRDLTKELNSRAIRDASVGVRSFSGSSRRRVGDYLVGLGEFGEPYLLTRITSLEFDRSDRVGEDVIYIKGTEGCEEWRDSGDGIDEPSTDRNDKMAIFERLEIVWPKEEEAFP